MGTQQRPRQQPMGKHAAKAKAAPHGHAAAAKAKAAPQVHAAAKA